MRRAAWLMLAGLVISCGSGPTDDGSPGDLIAALSTTNATDGALLIRITGPVSQVAAVGGHRLSAATAAGTTRVVITGDIAAGDLLRITVPDTRDISSYSVVVEQAAERESYTLFDVSGYSITVRVQQ